MLVLTAKQLEHQGVSVEEANEASQIRTTNKIFTRGRDFPKHRREAAVKLGHKYLDDGIFCFIAENDHSLTVWVEKKEAILPSSNMSNHKTTAQSPTALVTTETKTLPSVIKESRSYTPETTLIAQNRDRKHRGDVERQLPSQSPPVQDKSAKKRSRKYRGISY
ncbi:MAG: hypothetical protein F6K58_15355 [Symploca sp. SIO2E9]|nr:hypothetical protein [Symploca sp. SIO2E9]